MFIIYVLLIKGEHEKKCIITVFGVWVEGRGGGGTEDVNTTSH